MASSAVVADPSEPVPSQAMVPPDSALLLSTPRSPTPRKSASCLLPYIDSSRGGVVQSGGASASPSPRAPSGIVTNDFLPPDLLFTLRRQGPGVAGDLPPPRGGAPLPPSGRHPLTQVQAKTTPTGGPGPAHPPANMWNYPARRAKLKHLMDHPPCICGAGKDISFLYDVAPEEMASRDDSTKPKSILPNSLIPEEYHMVKHPGVLGLEFHDDHYSTRSEDHDHHMTIFPSTRPAGRHEAIALRHTMDQMLLRAGIPHQLRDSSLLGPTEMHNLLELVKKEQDIYNICFHELIRQVSVHCVERGELLAEIRRRYCNLLDRIPRQVKSLHDEIVAQRALDRRLTSELKKFKSRITALTDELSEVRDHDVYVTEQSAEAQDNLASALAASEKNANLLAEYHDLYELQRKRLEDQVAHLTMERELWQQAAYDLARTVASECRLSSVQRLQLGEKAWAKLAGHFAILLSNKDTQQLSEVQGSVQQWREEVVGVVSQLVGMEARMNERLSTVEEGMREWSEELDDITDRGGVLQVPNQEKVGELWAGLRVWQAVINEEAEHFIGDALLQGQEKIKSVTKLVESWTETSLQLFSRHQPSRDHAHHPGKDSAPSPEQQAMLKLNTAIDACLFEVAERLSGENGVATGFIHLITPLETWDAKLGLLLSSTDKKLPDSDWIKLQTLVKEWLEKIHDIRGYIGHVQREGGSTQESPSLEQLVVDAEKWQSALTYSIDSQDAKTIDQVTNLHSSLVRWMVQLLLGFTGTKKEEQQGEEPGHASPTSAADLHGDLSALSDTLTNFTSVLSRSCTDLVQEIVDLHRKEGYADAEEELQELQRLREEATEWVRLGGLLAAQLKEGRGTGEEGEGPQRGEGKEGPTAEEPAEGRGEEEEEGERGGGAFPELPKKMSIIGADDNIHPKSLQQAIEETVMSPTPSMVELGLATEDGMPEGRGPQVKDAEVLLISLDETKKKLTEQEALTEQARERAVRAEKELEDVRSQLSMAEAELQQLRASKEPSKPAKTRKTSSVSRKVSRPGLGTPQTPSRSESRRKL